MVEYTLYLLIYIILYSFIIWGVGCFACWAFDIPFEFAFKHGLVCSLAINLLDPLFGGRSKN